MMVFATWKPKKAVVNKGTDKKKKEEEKQEWCRCAPGGCQNGGYEGR